MAINSFPPELGVVLLMLAAWAMMLLQTAVDARRGAEL
jgi:hypothetical protein